MATYEAKQISEILNSIMPGTLGESAVVAPDLANIVDVGTTLHDAELYDPICGKLIARIGREVYVTRKFVESLPPVLRDSWEFGQIAIKVRNEMPRVVKDTEAWKLQDGVSVDPFVYHKPTEISVTAFVKNTTFEIDWSITKVQFYGAFTNAAAMSAFFGMISTNIEKTMVKEVGNLQRMLYQEVIADAVYEDFGSGSLSGGSGVRAVNIFYLYKQQVEASPSFTATTCIFNTSYNKFAAYVIGAAKRHMKGLSGSYNSKHFVDFTPIEDQTLVLLDDYQAALAPYMEADTFHNEVIKFPASYGIDYWQTPGQAGYAFGDVSKVTCTTSDGAHSVTVDNVIGVLHSKDALSICCEKDSVESIFNPATRQTNFFQSRDARYIVDPYENVIVFFNA